MPKFLNDIDVTGDIQGTSLDINGVADISGNLSLVNDNYLLFTGGMKTAGNFDAARIQINSSNTVDTSGFHGMRFATSTAANYGWSFGANRSSSGRGSLRFYEHNNSNTGTERFTLLQDGNVGIGTASPSEKLDVEGSIAVRRIGTTTVATRYLNGTGHYLEAPAGYHALIVKEGGAEWMRVTNAGLVGIGTTSPSKKLHTYSSDNEGIFMEGTGGGHWFNFKSGASNLWSMGAQAGKMGWYNRTDSTYKMVIEDSGDVGIGTASPSAKLDVDGEVQATSLDINGAADISGTLDVGAINSDAVVTINPGSSAVGTLKLRRDTTADNTIVGDIEFMTTAAQGTDDRIALIRSLTSGGSTSTRGGEMRLYTRKTDSNFNTTTYYSSGQWTFPGEIEAASLDINGNADISGTTRFGNTVTIVGTNSTNAESVLLRGISSNDGDWLGSIRTANTGGYNQEMRFYTSNANGTSDEDLTLTLKPDQSATFAGNATFAGAVTASSLRCTNIVTNKVVKFNGTQLDDANITDTGSLITLGSNTVVSGELEATSLDINGAADISGNLTGVNTLTASNFVGTGGYHEFGNGTGSVSNDGSWHARVNIAGTSHARLDVKDLSDGIITSMFAHTGQGAGKLGTYSNHPVHLVVNGTSRATLDSSANFAVAGELEGGSLDINGNADISGNITSANWTGDVIASAYLDTDTAHLSSTQTFTGAKTFTGTVALTGTGRITGVDTVSAATDATSAVWVGSRGENLFSNGSGLLGDITNMPGFTFDGSHANNSSGAFKWTGTGTPFTGEFIPVDATRKVKMQYDAKTQNGGGRYYGFTACYDVDNNQIYASNHMYRANTSTTLAVQLVNGATTVTLAGTGSAWYNAGTAGASTHLRSFIIWEYANSFGYVYPPETYSRLWFGNSWDPGDINGNVITLRVPWAGGTYPVGTRLSNGSSGGTFKYNIMSNKLLTTDWVRQYGYMDGVDYSGANVYTKFPPGTAKIKLGWLMNYQNLQNGEIAWFTNIQVNNATSEDSEVRDAVERASDSNTFTDADHTKLNAAVITTGNQTIGGIKEFTSEMKLGTYNSTVGGILNIYGTTANKQSTIKTTNGNLHIDAADGHILYLNYYTGVNAGSNIIFGNGNSAASGAYVRGDGGIVGTAINSTGVVGGNSLDINGNADISGTTALGGKLTITSTSDSKLNLRTTSGDSSEWNYIDFTGTNGTRDAYIGTDGTGNPLWNRDDGGVSLKLNSNYINASHRLNVQGELEATSLDINGNADISGNLAVDGIANLDNTDIDGTFNATGTTFDVNSSTSLTLDNTNTTNGVKINTATSGSPVTIGHATSEVLIADNLTINGNLTTKGDVIIENTTNLAIRDTIITLNDGTSGTSGTDSSDIGIMMERHGANKFFGYDASENEFIMVESAADVSGAVSGVQMGTTQTLAANIRAYDSIKIGETANDAVSVFPASTTTSLGTSNTLVPTQNAVKTYVDAKTWNWNDITAGTVPSTILNSNVTSVSGNAGTVTNGVYTTGDQSIAGKKSFAGPIKIEQTWIYDKSAGSLDTTGYACAGLSSGSNGNSATFVFECGGGAGSTYQKIVYNCWNVSGTWNTSKDIDEGANDFDVTVSSNASTITFTFKTRSGSQNYTPRVHVQAMGHSIVTTY